MKNTCLIVVLIIFSVFKSYSQSITFNTKSFYGIWNNETSGYYYGGGGLDLLYEHRLKKGALRGGLEFRSIDWGNQLSINTGFKAPYITKEKWSFNGITSLGLGLALFKESPLFVWSAGYMPEFSWHVREKFHLNFGFGIRYTNSPAYKNYGSINHVMELPLKIGFQFNLGVKSS